LVVSAIAALALVVTLFGAVIFFPRLSISSDATLDPADPFATPFILRNDGYFSVYSADIFCEMVQVIAASKNDSMNGVGFTSPNLLNKTIGPDSQIEFMCPQAFIFPAPITSAEIQIYFGFRATLFPKSCTKQCFRLITKPDKDNKLRWFTDSDTSQCAKPGTILKYAPRQTLPNYPPELR